MGVYSNKKNKEKILKYNKYKNEKTTIDGYKFDSKKEAKRYGELKLLLRAKKIKELKLQPKFLLQPSFKHKGVTHRAINYIADFAYIQDGKVIVEDVKSSAAFKTDVYRIKKKIFLSKYGEMYDFREIV